ncbi:MAG: nucleotidyltransferase domain-containing protein [Bacteroidales bacterium]|jgi:predicted nucleotidyltransferase|nr:nucleotidyltransferase domain-containing protein [Bacteroidales bacterium]MBR4176902.1 nucleotidyltransferase domain-containing protein [Bacteroidales bacterium]
MSIIESNIERIIALCKQHSVDTLSVFGSVLTPRFNDESDIDLLVRFKSLPTEEYADNYLQFSESLSEVLGREIDLVEEKAIHNPYFLSNIEQSKVQIYGRV